MGNQFLPPAQLVGAIYAQWMAYDQAHPGTLDHLTSFQDAQIGNTSGDFLLQGLDIGVSGGDGNVIVAGLLTANNVVQLGNGNDSVGMIGVNDRVSVGSGVDRLSAVGIHNQVSTGGGFDIIGYQGAGDTFILGGGTAVIGASGYSGGATFIAAPTTNLIVNATPSFGDDTFVLSGGTAALSLGGEGDRIDIRGAVQATLTNFSGVVDLLPSLGYANSFAAAAALHSDGNGGSMLSLAGGGSIDFVGVAPGHLHAGNFAIG